MAASALIKFTQNGTVGADGVSLRGVTGAQVTVENADNTDVQSWQIDLVYVDPRSGLSEQSPLAFDDNDNTPTATFTPDVPGSYRLQLTVYESTGRTGTENVDIRNFVIPEPKHGFIRPPYQKLPDPRPLPGETNDPTQEKSDELNFNGNDNGWAGGGGTVGLINDFIAQVDASNFDDLPDLSTASAGDSPVATETAYNTPLSMVYDGVDVWVLNSNFLESYSGNSATSPYVGRINVASGKVVEIASFTDPGAQGALAGAILFDFTFNGTDLWAVGVDSDFNGIVVRIDRTPGELSFDAVGGSFAGSLFIRVDYDNSGNLWIVDGTGGQSRLLKIDPSNPGVLDETLAFPNILTLSVDRDISNYGDTNPRVWVGTTGGSPQIHRVNAVGTPAIEDSTAGAGEVRSIAFGNGNLYYVSGGILRESNPSTLAPISDETLAGEFANAVLTVRYDAGNDKIWVYGIDGSDNPKVARYPVGLAAVEDSVVLTTSTLNDDLRTVGVYPQMVVANGFLWALDAQIEDIAPPTFGPGSAHYINLTGALSSSDVGNPLFLEYSAVVDHASSHISGGTGEIDGDQLDIDWNPSNYIPTTNPAEVSSVDHLTAHLAGIDNAVGVSIISPPQITANQNDYAPTGLATADILRLDSDGDYNLTGLDATGVSKLVKKLINIGANTLTIKSEDAGSSAANRFITIGDLDVGIGPREVVDVFYDSVTARWRLV